MIIIKEQSLNDVYIDVCKAFPDCEITLSCNQITIRKLNIDGSENKSVALDSSKIKVTNPKLEVSVV